MDEITEIAELEDIEQKTILTMDRRSGFVLLEEHYLGKKLHRADGPAYIKRYAETGMVREEAYFWNGWYHRDDGPAHLIRNVRGMVVEINYYRHGFLHRNPAHGPATVNPCDHDPTVAAIEEYYLHGLPYRDPNIGPYCIMRNAYTGKVTHERFCKPEDLFDPSRPPPRSQRPRDREPRR